MKGNWRRAARTGFFFAVSLGLSQVARASQLAFDGFNYNAGPLAGSVDTQVTPNQTWGLTGPSGSGTSIIAGSLLGPANLPPASGNMDQLSKALTGADRIALTSTVSDPSATTGTETIYYSMLLNVSSISGYTTTSGSFISGVNNATGSQAGTLSTAGGVLCIAAPVAGQSGSNFVLGVGENQAGTGARVFDQNNVYAGGDTLFLVVAYTLNPGASNDVAKLYVYKNSNLVDAAEPATANATSDASQIAGVVDVNTAGNGFVSFFLRNNGSEPTNINVDEVRVGTTWADVVPTPEPASLSALALAVPLLSRRRRRA